MGGEIRGGSRSDDTHSRSDVKQRSTEAELRDGYLMLSRLGVLWRPTGSPESMRHETLERILHIPAELACLLGTSQSIRIILELGIS